MKKIILSPVVLGLLVASVCGAYPFNQFSSSNVQLPAAISIVLSVISLPVAPGLILSLALTNIHDPNMWVAFALNWILYAILFHLWQRRRLKHAS